MTYCSGLENNVCPREKVWPIGFYPKSTVTHNVVVCSVVGVCVCVFLVKLSGR